VCWWVQASCGKGFSRYDAFGAQRAATPIQYRLGYAGEQVGAETGFAYLRARYYDPEQGRFLTRDTVQPNAPGTRARHRCAHVANNAATGWTPAGTASVT
jgi:RHS repeat-associated protein